MNYRSAGLLTLSCLMAIPSLARAEEAAPASTTGADMDAIIVTGTRERSRTADQTLAPVDVLSQQLVQSSVSNDMNDTLAQLLPSFNVQRLPAADGQAFVRPATLRGLPGDYVLVLVNGKRYHGSAASQATDLSSIPSTAVKRIEVLRDGASAQYGSDAIAGVINIILEDRPGMEAFGQFSQYYEGDGDEYRVGVRGGAALGANGSIVLTGEYSDGAVTSRTRQRPDAITYQAAHPELVVPDPVQRWGQPEEQRIRGAIDAHYTLADAATLYVFGTVQSGEGLTDFNWRNPDATASVYKGTKAFPGFSFLPLYPTGFTPRFGTEYSDQQLAGGLRGDLGESLSYDLSADYGHNSTRYTMSESLNASLGPASPTSFYLGRLAQEEFILNADFVYRLPVGGAEPINLAFGAERRSETYKVAQGERASWEIGPGAAEGLATGANGFPGFEPARSGQWNQTSYAGYVDLEWKPVSLVTLGAAGRYEDYDSFGGTFNYKFSGRIEPTSRLALRATYSTGFRAPDPAQLYSTNTAQSLNTTKGTIDTRGRLRVDDPVAIALGAKPLKPEKSRNFTAGLVYNSQTGLVLSADVYQIEVRDRLTTSPQFTVPTGFENPKGYTAVNYYMNAYKTRTRGVDLVLSYRHPVGPGTMNLNLSYNYNQTRMLDDGGTNLNETSRVTFEQKLPRHNATGTLGYDVGPVSLLARARYYGAWTDISGNGTEDLFQDFGAMVLVDLSATYKLNEHISLRAGAENLFNSYPDEATNQAVRGLIYSRNAPYDTDGGQYYVRFGVTF
ncbi:TonB-dependent receptor plug domain-containing protein [Novosphingobium album (ex Liu et al. 2023)]|uniref:TonB-dependent receptor n=1 Tax=Novosphingobium album (ex Liu et al. 2023) TaxID=3031130 RepID=A0ABT5WR98_9SPHN|nr:TonB-dependent receptor [Novosphingobium album (ex Liu et al. 2023)]MDE8651508.1 TonB-dependent receptor [Novosphingobium album (ex Liu et al. 2023)]